MPNNLKEACRQLRLSGLAASLELRLQEAASHQLPHAQFLELLFQDELNVRQQRQLERRKRFAHFRDLKPLEDFDWSFNPDISQPLRIRAVENTISINMCGCPAQISSISDSPTVC